MQNSKDSNISQKNDSSENGSKSCIENLGMSKNIATQLNHLTLKSNTKELCDLNCETSMNELCKHHAKRNLNLRSTPKQVFPNMPCLPPDSIIFCFVVSVWDNIVGPQTVYVWHKKPKSCVIKNCTKIKKNPSATKEKDTQISHQENEKICEQDIKHISSMMTHSSNNSSLLPTKKTLLPLSKNRIQSSNSNG